MDLILTQEQEDLLRQTRDVLGDLREALAAANAPEGERKALGDSIRQLDELFLLVVAGEFNAGKSAFINALLDTDLQAEGVTPTTDAIYHIVYGPTAERKAAERGIWRQTAPVELLREISIVDTPGTNAIMREHEALTAEFIPRSDLVLFITSADRPFTESERSFLVQIQAWGKKIVLIINKIDILPDEGAVQEVADFVTAQAQKLVGSIPAVFPVSARLARRDDPDGRFDALEQYIRDTLDDDSRFRLKLLNPLGVGHKLVRAQLATIEDHLAVLTDDTALLDDIQRQTLYYNEDMQRNFKARIAEIDGLLFEMEKRGNAFFDDRIRLARIPDLLRSKQLEYDYEKEVVGDTPQQIEYRVGELVDWLVEQDLRQWTAVSEHLTERGQAHAGRIVGEAGPREGTLAYDRQRLIDSIGRATRQAVSSYDKEAEAKKLAEGARTAVAGTAIAEIGGLGLGAIIAALGASAFDITGLVAGVTIMTVGLFILPTRKRKAKQEFAERLESLRNELVESLTQQFDREMRRSTQRIEDTIAPFSRFVRAEESRLTEQHAALAAVEAHVEGLQRHLGEGEARKQRAPQPR